MLWPGPLLVQNRAMSSSSSRYRSNVAAIVLNSKGEILCCERSDRKGAWQLPQGGIEQGETTEEALFRELLEEILTNSVSVIGRLDGPIRYEWPEHLHSRGFIGQEQHYFLVRLTAAGEKEFSGAPSEEFAGFEWTGAAEFLARCSGFKAEAYRTALAAFREMFPGVIVP